MSEVRREEPEATSEAVPGRRLGKEELDRTARLIKDLPRGKTISFSSTSPEMMQQIMDRVAELKEEDAAKE